MKSDKNFIRLGLILLLGCMASSTIFAKFSQKEAKFQNETNKVVVNVALLDATNQIVKMPALDPAAQLAMALAKTTPIGTNNEFVLNLTQAMGQKSLPLGGAEKIRIMVSSGYTTYLLGL